MKTYDIYGLGAALVDTEIEVSDDFLTSASVEKGLMILVDEERQQQLTEQLKDHAVASHRASGGSACNSVIANSYFGGKSFYSCKVAADENGKFYLDDLDRAGVDYNSNANQQDGVTGKCLVMITPDAERSMSTFLGISELLSVDELDEAALCDSQYLYVEGYRVTSPSSRAAAVRAREIAQQNGVKMALSFSDPGMVEFFKDGLLEMLGGRIDLVFCNEDEALGWGNTKDINVAIDSIKQVADTFAITLGAKGALLFDGEKLIEIEPYAVKAVDTNGAGDMFAGAFLHGLTRGFSFEQAGKLASRAAAQVVSDFGPRLKPELHAQILAEFE